MTSLRNNVSLLIAASICVFFSRADAAELVSPFESEVRLAIAAHSAPAGIAPERETVRFFGGVTPHHDIALPMIARFYERIASSDAKRVWLLSPDHFHRARKFAAVCDADWKLKTKILESDYEACAAIGSLGIAERDAGLFAGEHGITIHIPLIAEYFPNARVVPMVLDRDIPDMGILILRKKIMELWNDGDVIILSMDLSHYKTPEAMAAEDERTLGVLTRLEPMKTNGIDADARRAASLVTRLFKDLGAKRGVVMEHTDLSDILGCRAESGTSYATIVYGDF